LRSDGQDLIAEARPFVGRLASSRDRTVQNTESTSSMEKVSSITSTLPGTKCGTVRSSSSTQ
jgi:hypothetical protein